MGKVPEKSDLRPHTELPSNYLPFHHNLIMTQDPDHDLTNMFGLHFRPFCALVDVTHLTNKAHILHKPKRRQILDYSPKAQEATLL